jgi:hypothetical protein
MTKKELKKLLKDRDLKKGEYKVTFEPSTDNKKVTLEFDSLKPMQALDFLLMLVDWTNEFALQLYLKANDKEPIEHEPDLNSH